MPTSFGRNRDVSEDPPRRMKGSREATRVFDGAAWGVQFTPGSRITLRPLPPPTSDREYTPARSADRHRPEAHCRRLSILSPAVTATGTTFCAAIVDRSLLAAERSVWVAGVVDVEVVVRREVVWPVSVVVAVDMGTWDLLGDVDGKDRPRRRAAARSEKAPG